MTRCWSYRAAPMTILLCYKSPQYLTAAALLDRLIWREKLYVCRNGFGGLRGLWSGCVGLWRLQWDHRRPCPTSAAGDITDLVKSSFGGLRDLWSGCLWMHLFMAVLMTPLATSSDISGRSYAVCFLTATALLARTCVITLDCTHWPLHLGGRGVIRSGRHLTEAAISSCNDVIRIVFSLLRSPSLVCWIGPTAVRKKVARVPQGRGLKKIICGICESVWDPSHFPRGRILGRNWDKVLRVFLFAIHSHIY